MMVKVLTEKLHKLTLAFDRAAYRKSYDAVYFRKRVKCPHCRCLKVKHMLKRHMQTAKCKSTKSE
jgi:hypothetical protein